MAAAKKKKLTKKEIKLALALLLVKLADGRTKPSRPGFGICSNVEDFFLDMNIPAWAYDAIPAYALGWPKHSGDEVYPVKLPRRADPVDCWGGSYGRARKELCTYIANKLRREVRKGDYTIRRA